MQIRRSALAASGWRAFLSAWGKRLEAWLEDFLVHYPWSGQSGRGW